MTTRFIPKALEIGHHIVIPTKHWWPFVFKVVVHKATNIAPIAVLHAESVYKDKEENLHFFISKTRDDDIPKVLKLNGCESRDENNDKLKFSFIELESKVKVTNDLEKPCIGIVDGIQFGEYNFQVSINSPKIYL